MNVCAISLGCIAVIALSCPAPAQEQCLRPTPVEALEDIQAHHLALKSLRGYYVIDNNCTILSRRAFAKVLPFSILPDASSDITYVFARSYRMFTNTTPANKIKMVRGANWFFPSDSTAKVSIQPKLDDEPYLDSVEAWNKAHGVAGNPEEFKNRLKALWHAYAGENKELPSTQDAAYWIVRDDFDSSHGTITNYLLRVPPESRSPIPFKVYAQDQVKSVDLVIDSNNEALSGKYKFVLE
jgi:hypothetical protein